MRAMLLPAVAVLALVTACADSPGGGSAPATDGEAGAGDTGAPAGDDLRIVVDHGDGSPAEEYTLTCGDDPTGTLTEPAAACEHLRGMTAPFQPVPADAVCTEQYGGPQTARITGTWGGEDVDLELSRINGCYISQWDELGPVLPGTVGDEGPETPGTPTSPATPS